MAITDTIEALQKDVTQITTELAETKKLEDEALKKTKAEAAELKAEALLGQVTTAKEEANKQLEALKGKTDATSVAEISKLEEEIKKYEAMLVTLNTSKMELTDLKSGIVDLKQEGLSEEDINKEDDEETVSSDKKKKKNKYDGENTWLEKQIHGLTSKEERKTNTGANIARAVGGIGVIGLTIRGIKKLFGRGKKNDQSTETQNNNQSGNASESTSGKSKRWKKLLIGLGVGTGGYYLVHGIVTGKWEIKDFFDWEKEDKINPDDLNERYDSKVPEALKPKYDKFAGMVDDYRKNNGNTDTLGILEDKEGAKTEIKRGAIPAVMDHVYDNVGDILNTNNDILDERGRCGQKIWGLVSSLGGKVVGGLFKGGVGLIKGLKTSMFGADGQPNEEFKKWAETEDLTRDEQVANLLQKYSMVRTYLNDKRKQLTRKYTIEQLETEKGISNPTEEQIEEYELNKDLVEMRVERDFLSKKIASLDSSGSAIDALENAGVFDSSVSVETQAVLDEVKNIRKEIVPDETIWSRAKNSSDINKDDGLRTELNGISTKFSDHLKKGILHRNILEGIANGWGILNLDELRNSEADDLEEAIEKLGFGDEVKRFKLQNNDFYSKLQSKTLTKADIETFEKTINDYFSLLQQVMLETQTQQENEGSWEWKTRFMGRSYELINSGGTYVIVGGLLLNAGVKRWLRMKKSPVRYVVDFSSKPVKWMLRTPMRKIGMPNILGNRFLKNRSYGNTNVGFETFWNDFQKGKIAYKDAEFVYGRKIKQTNNVRPKGNGDLFESLLISKGLSTDQIQMMQKYFDGKAVRGILVKNPSIKVFELANKLKAFDAEFNALPAGKSQKFLGRVLDKGKFTTLADLENLTKNMSKIDFTLINNLDDKSLYKLADELSKDISSLTTADKFNAKINSLKVSTASDVFDIIDPKIAKEKVAFDIYETRKTNLDNLTKEFDAGGKYEKYGPKYKSLYEDPHANLQVLDKQLADEMVDAKDPEVTKILDKIKTDQLKIFNKNIDDNITILTRTQGSLGTTAPDKIAKKTIQKQIDDLAVIKGMATKMNKQELEAFEGLMNIFKNKPHFQGDMISVREKAKSNETLMKALSEGDVDELKRLKSTGISEITDDMIKVFEDIKIKKVAKVLAASNVEDIIKPLLKAFARLT